MGVVACNSAEAALRSVRGRSFSIVVPVFALGLTAITILIFPFLVTPSPRLPALSFSDDSGSVLERLPATLSLFRAGRYSDAEDGFESIIAALPGPDRAVSGAAVLELTDAREYLRVLAGLHSNLGLVRMRSREWQSAESALVAAVSIDPQHVGAHLNLGLTLIHQRRFAEARHQIEAAQRLGRNGPKLQLDLGRAHLALAEHGRARSAFTRARTMAGRQPSAQSWGVILEARMLTAVCDLEQGWAGAAREQLEQVLDMAPGHVQARYRLVQLLEGLGETSAAAIASERLAEDRAMMAAIQQELASSPDEVQALHWIADTYRRLGLLHLADAHYRQLSIRNPEDTRPLLARLQIKRHVVDAMTQRSNGPSQEIRGQ